MEQFENLPTQAQPEQPIPEAPIVTPEVAAETPVVSPVAAPEAPTVPPVSATEIPAAPPAGIPVQQPLYYTPPVQYYAVPVQTYYTAPVQNVAPPMPEQPVQPYAPPIQGYAPPAQSYAPVQNAVPPMPEQPAQPYAPPAQPYASPVQPYTPPAQGYVVPVPVAAATPVVPGAAKVFSIISFICGILSLCTLYNGLSFAIVGMIFGNLALSKAPQHLIPKANKGRIMSKVGLFVSIGWIVLYAIIFISSI